MLPIDSQQVAAIIDESLQEMVQKDPPEGRSVQHPLALKGTKSQTEWGVFSVDEALHHCKR